MSVGFGENGHGDWMTALRNEDSACVAGGSNSRSTYLRTRVKRGDSK